jgi:hypothetical protein
MKLQLALASITLVSLALPAAAQSDYWIVQNMHTRHCEIVSQRPVGEGMTIIGDNGIVYHSHVQAEDAMRTVKVCHSN